MYVQIFLLFNNCLLSTGLKRMRSFFEFPSLAVLSFRQADLRDRDYYDAVPSLIDFDADFPEVSYCF